MVIPSVYRYTKTQPDPGYKAYHFLPTTVKLKPTNACQSGVGANAVESWQRQIEKMFFIIILDLKQLFSLDV